jgi:hypothetical protein
MAAPDPESMDSNGIENYEIRLGDNIKACLMKQRHKGAQRDWCAQTAADIAVLRN